MFYILFCVLCIFALFFVCSFSFVCSCLFPVFVPIYRPLPPGRNPVAVNSISIPSHHTKSLIPLLAYSCYSIHSASFKIITHEHLSSALFLLLSKPIDSRSFSIQPIHLNFGLPAFLLPPKKVSNIQYSPITRLL